MHLINWFFCKIYFLFNKYTKVTNDFLWVYFENLKIVQGGNNTYFFNQDRACWKKIRMLLKEQVPKPNKDVFAEFIQCNFYCFSFVVKSITLDKWPANWHTREPGSLSTRKVNVFILFFKSEYFVISTTHFN